MNTLEENLLELSNYSARELPPEWNHIWWNDYYTPMLKEGYFIAPLISYNVFAACSLNYDSRPGLSSNVGRLKKYNNLYDYISKLTRKCIGKIPDNPNVANALFFKYGKYFTKQISCRFMDKVDLQDELSFNVFKISSEEILFKELENLNSLEHPLATDNKWFRNIIEHHVYSELISQYELLPFKGRERFFVDPFLGSYIKKDSKHRYLFSNIYGSQKIANSKSRILGAVGEFAKRDIGELPEELNRLAPSELLVLSKSILKNQQIRRNKLEKGCRLQFLIKSYNGELWQRYSSRIASSHTMPLVLLQIDFFDDIEYHKITHSPKPPRVTFYRSTIINLITQAIQSANDLNWSLNLLINHRLYNLTESLMIKDESLFKLGNNNEKCLAYLIQELPALFVSGVSINTSKTIPMNSFEDYSVWARICLGEEQRNSIDKNSQDIFSLEEIGMRLEFGGSGAVFLKESFSALEAEKIVFDNNVLDDLPLNCNVTEYAAKKIIAILTGN